MNYNQNNNERSKLHLLQFPMSTKAGRISIISVSNINPLSSPPPIILSTPHPHLNFKHSTGLIFN